METRSEKWKKYRQEIELTHDDNFPGSTSYYSPMIEKDLTDIEDVENPAMAISFGAIMNEAKKSNASSRSMSPYKKYQRRILISRIIRISISVILILIMLMWYLLRLR